jgi:hypothetical protein
MERGVVENNVALSPSLLGVEVSGTDNNITSMMK